MAVSAKSITEIVSKVECGKAAGPDEISAECFEFFNTKIHVLLSLFFSMWLSHGYWSSAPIKAMIVPIVNKIDARRTSSLFPGQECGPVTVLVCINLNLLQRKTCNVHKTVFGIVVHQLDTIMGMMYLGADNSHP